PQIASAAVFTQAHDEKIVASALDQNSFILVGQHPYVTSPIGGFIARQGSALDLLWPDAQKSRSLVSVDDLVALEGGACGTIAGPEPQGRLVGEQWLRQRCR